MAALGHLRDWAEYQRSSAEEYKRQRKELFEEDADNILYLVVGAALTSWATMEETMVIILAKLLRTELEKAGLILYSTINFNVWISIIDELFAIDALFSPLKPRWNKLADRLRRLKDNRDRIAHHGLSKRDGEKSTFAEITLKPSVWDIRQKSLKYKPMANDDIRDFTSQVVALSKDLLDLAVAMPLPSSPEKSAE